MVKVMAAYEELAPRFKEALMDWQETKNPFWSLLGMELGLRKISKPQTRLKN
jgi:hypothetical protein